MGKGKAKKYVVLSGVGDPCPRCRRATQIRGHIAVTAQHKAQPFYYSKWFFCVNMGCPTQQIMPEQFKVYRDGAPQPSAPASVARPGAKLTPRHVRLLALISTGPVSRGLTVGEELRQKGLVRELDARLLITPAGSQFLQNHGGKSYARSQS